MSLAEIFVIVGGAFVGYVIVYSLINQNENKSEKANTDSNSFKRDKRFQSNERINSDHSDDKERFIEENWFRILDIPESASIEEISTQYKRKIREYHPDKVASLGKEIRDLAEYKSKEINSAYEFAKTLKGS
jgi:DnaJ-domain-containing protein 1